MMYIRDTHIHTQNIHLHIHKYIQFKLNMENLSHYNAYDDILFYLDIKDINIHILQRIKESSLYFLSFALTKK